MAKGNYREHANQLKWKGTPAAEVAQGWGTSDQAVVESLPEMNTQGVRALLRRAMVAAGGETRTSKPPPPEVVRVVQRHFLARQANSLTAWGGGGEGGCWAAQSGSRRAAELLAQLRANFRQGR